MLATGAIIGGRYRIEGLCGSGSFGTVYLAKNLRTGRKWAVKEIIKNVDQSGYKPAENEVRSLRMLSHPNLAALSDVFETRQSVLIFTDYIEGMTLSDYVRMEREKKGKTVSGENVLRLAREICSGLCYLQENGLIHGDLKPGNIMIDESFHPVIIDLGGAVRIENHKTVRLPVWTRGFSPPEARNGIAGPTTDIWSFGAVLRFLLGEQGEDGRKETVFFRIKKRNLRRNREEKMLFRELNRIADRCMKTRPEERYRSFQEIMQALSDPCGRVRTKNRKNRRFKAAVWILTAAIPVFSGLSVYGGQMKMKAEEKTYQECLDRAGRSGREEAIEYYRLAVMLRPQDKEAYLGLIDLLCRDNELTDEEDAVITGTLNAVEYDRKVRNEDMLKAYEQQYLPVAYRLGTAYYYCTDDLLKEAAVKYLSDVADAPTGNDNSGSESEKKEVWKEQCTLLGKMIRYENRLGRGDYLGENEVTYLDYWNDLDLLVRRAEERKEEDVTVLWCVRDLLTKICTFADRFYEAGVSGEDMKEMIYRVEKLAGNSGRESGIRKAELKDSIRELADRALIAADAYSVKEIQKEAG